MVPIIKEEPFCPFCCAECYEDKTGEMCRVCFDEWGDIWRK